MKAERSFAFVGFAIVLSAVLAACGTVMVRDGVPNAQLASVAQVADLPGLRSWGDEVPSDFRSEVRRRLPNLPNLAQRAQESGGRPVIE